MNLHRISKKVPHVDHRQTLPSLHKQKLNEFAKHRETLPDKEKLLGQLIVQYKSDDCSTDRYELYKKITSLQDEVRKLRDNFYEIEYLTHSASYLNAYYTETEKTKTRHEQANESETEDDTVYEEADTNDLSNFVKQEDGTIKGKIYKEYTEFCLSGNYTPSLPREEESEEYKLN